MPDQKDLEENDICTPRWEISVEEGQKWIKNCKKDYFVENLSVEYFEISAKNKYGID